MKKTQSFSSISKQSGNAAILFALLIPILFCIFILASDGARALQTKARLDDALEAASLAVAADDNVDPNLAKAYVKQYMTDISSPPIVNVDTSTGKNNKGLPILEYQLSATTTHKSWFPGNDEITGFGDKFTVSGRSITKRYQSDDIDIVFAADFSGSMKRKLNGSNKPKYKDLIEIIGEVTDVLDQFNVKSGSNNTASFTAFNIYTNKYIHSFLGLPTAWCYVDEKYYTNAPLFSNPLNLPWWPKSLLFYNVDYKKTLDQMFTAKKCRETVSTFNWFRPHFHDVLPTSNFKEFRNEIKNFKPLLTSDTAIYQGIIRGAQLAKMGQNPRRLIIVLSDGQDSTNGILPEVELLIGQTGDHKNYTKELVKKGMCKKIRHALNSNSVTSKIAIIGFDYSEDEDINSELQECTSDDGGDNTFKSQNREAIKRKILELISEEIGHLS